MLINHDRLQRWSARLDIAESLSGLLLVIFMWGHMLFVSSILLGEQAMWTVTKTFEGYFIFGRSYPLLVSAVVAVVAALFVMHALLALRKIPANYRDWIAFRRHRQMLRHTDTSLWSVQVVTGVVLLFIAGAHLQQMLLHPSAIGPYQSADRVWSGRWWPLYLLLLFMVELHGGIGLYRLLLKWGVFGNASRRRLQVAKWLITSCFILLGLVTLAAYAKLGYEHRDSVGEIYQPPDRDAISREPQP